MTAKLFLGSIIIIVGVYTAPVVADYGLLTLLPSFFGEMSKMNWQGQFNLDFFMFLLMSGFWIAWRNRFSPATWDRRNLFGRTLPICLPALSWTAPWLGFQ